MHFLHKPHTTEVLFILIGPRMPFRFQQCQYRLLIVNSISLFNSVIKSKENIIQNSESQVVTCCSLP